MATTGELSRERLFDVEGKVALVTGTLKNKYAACYKSTVC